MNVCPAISARKLAEVAGHGILIVWGGGRMLHLNASQSTLVAGICTRVARLEVYSSSNVEKNTRLHNFAIDQLSDDRTTPPYYAYKDLLTSFFFYFKMGCRRK